MLMRMQVRKWGNSLALRIPKPFARDAAVGEGTLVELSVSEGKLIIAPVQKKATTLRQLLRKMQPDKLHGEVDSGPPVGREVW